MRFARVPWDLDASLLPRPTWSTFAPPRPSVLRSPSTTTAATPVPDRRPPLAPPSDRPTSRKARRAHLQPKPVGTGPPPHVTARPAWREWRALGASGPVLRVLKDGFLFPWRRTPPP